MLLEWSLEAWGKLFSTVQLLSHVNKGPSGQGYGFSSGHVWM